MTFSDIEEAEEVHTHHTDSTSGFSPLFSRVGAVVRFIFNLKETKKERNPFGLGHTHQGYAWFPNSNTNTRIIQELEILKVHSFTP